MTSSEPELSPIDSSLKWVTPVLLASVAVLQIYQAFTGHLSPWNGGGFGMFAVFGRSGFSAEGTDEQGNKVNVALRFSGQIPEEEFNSEMKRSLGNYPRRELLEKYARIILANRLVPTGKRERASFESIVNGKLGHYFLSKPPASATKLYRLALPRDRGRKDAIRLKTLKITVWSLRFHPEDFSLRHHQLGEPVVVGAGS